MRTAIEARNDRLSAEKTIKAAAVVVTHNRLALLRQCIECLLQQTHICDVLVVDNDSSDGTETWVRQHMPAFPRVHYRNTVSNIGGAGGFHFGMRWAVEEGYSHIWLMDDDTLPNPSALQYLLEADQLVGGRYGFLSSAVFWKDGRECHMNRPKLCKAYYTQLELLQYGMIACEQATFVSCLFRAEVIQHAGLPIREFFIWGDDIEYTRRLSVRMGLPCYLVGKSCVVHAMESNNGSSIAHDAPARIQRYNYVFRNENYLYRQEGLRGWLYYAAKCGLNILRVLRFAKDYRFKRCFVIIRQFFLGLFFNPNVEYIGSQRRTDDEI